MTNPETTLHYSHLAHGEGIVRKHFINFTAPIEINGKPQDKFSIVLNLTIGEKLKLCTYVSIVEGFTSEKFFNHPQKGVTEKESQSIYLNHKLLKNIVDGVDFMCVHPSNEYTVSFKKKDDEYFLEGVSAVGSTIFYFSEETYNLIVSMFNTETELRNQLGW